jgi:Zn-dependent M28 family amino/carboxypeptidase
MLDVGGDVGASMKTALVMLSVAAVACLSAEPQKTADAPPFDSGRAYGHLRTIVGFGPRPAGSAALEQTRGYIREELKKVGLEPVDQAFDASTPVGKIHMVNVRATIPGPGTGRLVIAGHYDTKLFHDFPFVGANDGGSSAAFLIELARVLKARPHPLSIELLFLDGEEATGEWVDTDHTYGSRYYVEAARRDGTLKSLRALILVDMIGDRDLDIMREQNSTPWLTDAIWSAAARLKRPEFREESTPIEDDHLEFLEAGVPAVDIIDLDYPAWHRAEDQLDRVAAGSLQAVGDVLLAALPGIEERLSSSQ